MSKNPKNVQITQRGPQTVEYNGKRYLSVARGIVDGESAVLIVGGTSFWVPAAEVTC